MGPCVAMAPVGLESYARTAARRLALVVKMVAARGSAEDVHS